MDDQLASLLASACSRSAVTPQTFFALRERFPGYKLIRLSFGLQNKVMLSVSVDLEVDGRTHASYVPIHPTAAAAAVLQNNPVVVVRQDKRSPLWDQEDLYQREGCTAVNVVSMPFYWPPRPGAVWEGTLLAVPQSQAFHPTFGAMTVAGSQPLTQDAMNRLLDLALRTGRQVGPHISMLLASLEGAGLLPSELEAQEELGSLLDEGELDGEDGMEGLFDVVDSQAAAEADALLPGLASMAAAPAEFPPLEAQQQTPPPPPQLQQQQQQQPPPPLLPPPPQQPQQPQQPQPLQEQQQQQPLQQPEQQFQEQQQQPLPPPQLQPLPQQQQQQQQQEEEQQQEQQQQDGDGMPAAAAEPDIDAVPIPDWLLQGNNHVQPGGPDLLAAELRQIGGPPAEAQAAAAHSAGAAAAGAPDSEGDAPPVLEAAGHTASNSAAGPTESTTSAEAAGAAAAGGTNVDEVAPPMPEAAGARAPDSAPGRVESATSAGAAPREDTPPALLGAGRADDSPPGPLESSISEHTATVLTSSSASVAPAPPPATTSSPEDLPAIPPAAPSSTDPSTEAGAPAAPDGGAFALPGGGLPAALASGGMPRYPWTNVSFQPAGLERAFAANYSRRQQQWDLLSIALLGALLLGAAAMQLQACWPAGILALLCFAPYFVDPQQYYGLREWLVSAALLLLSVFLSSLHTVPASPRPLLASTCALPGGFAATGPACMGGPGSSAMVGFGIVWFVFHTCSLSYLLLAPLLLRMRASRALPVQACCLALALHRLPRAYASVLGRIDAVHLLLLGLLLLLGAAGGVSMAQAIECKQRVAWLGRRVRRAATTMAAAGPRAISSSSSG